MAEKMERVELNRTKTDTDSSFEDVSIEEDGRLHFSGTDSGEIPKKIIGFPWYEYDLHVPVDWKDTVLLMLIKERFASFGDAREWLDERGIPAKFSTWFSDT